MTLADLLRRYRDTISVTKRGRAAEEIRIRSMLRIPLASIRLDRLTPGSIARFRDKRLIEVSGSTVRRDLALLQHCIEVARREWDVPLASNPVKSISLPSPGRPRERRLLAHEFGALMGALEFGGPWHLKPIITLAVETGMRRGELLSLRWKDFDCVCQTIGVFRTKNGHPRTVPLTPSAMVVLSGLVRRHQDLIFPVSANAVRLAWERLKGKATISDLRFHDLRHEAVSRFFEMGLSVPEVALISGHRDTRMLLRYTHLSPTALAKKIERLAAYPVYSAIAPDLE